MKCEHDIKQTLNADMRGMCSMLRLAKSEVITTDTPKQEVKDAYNWNTVCNTVQILSEGQELVQAPFRAVCVLPPHITDCKAGFFCLFYHRWPQLPLSQPLVRQQTFCCCKPL